LQQLLRFGILGSGSWATALAKLLTDNGHTINWWIRNGDTIQTIQKRRHNPHYLSATYFNVALLHMHTSIVDVITKSDVLLVCIPSAYLQPALFELPNDIFQNKKVISAIKGILPNAKHQLLNEFLEEFFHVPLTNYFTVMGPCHAEEIAAEKLSYLTFSGEDTDMAATLAAYFKSECLNTVVNHDIWGTQYAAVLKNIYALGAGIAHGLEYGDNFLSVYIANATYEMVSFLRRVMIYKQSPDTDKITYASSVYLGDLLVTCYSLFSRNRTLGNMIGKGYSVKVAQLEMNMVAEGYPASKGIHHINKEINSSLPIVTTIYQILWEGLPAAEGFKKIEEVLK
jgi:glycerol-3-phosphate dehydrogenase (NAD(P)+)